MKQGDGESEGDVHEGDSRTFTLYEVEELEELANEAGFKIDSCEANDDGWIQLVAAAEKR
ncbi:MULTISPECIES: hypothetical protein [unclassified Haladaptatus]|uniref:hypothetical protein n=1 Tax=unclassified Haladaptatus TaxID=2622732 RepID=UPI0023E81E05|nr:MULTISPECIES: hypothetical protein [unclassified Haladaptatus]